MREAKRFLFENVTTALETYVKAMKSYKLETEEKAFSTFWFLS